MHNVIKVRSMTKEIEFVCTLSLEATSMWKELCISIARLNSVVRVEILLLSNTEWLFSRTVVYS